MKLSDGEVELTIRRDFVGLRQVTVINPIPEAGRTVSALMLAATFGRMRGGYVLAWDLAEAGFGQTSLAARAHGSLVHPSGELARQGRYVRRLGDATCDVLAGDTPTEPAIDAAEFGDSRDVLEQAYRLIVVDSTSDPEAAIWRAALDASDQLVIAMSTGGGSANAAAHLLDRLERGGRRRLVREAITVVTASPSRIRVDASAPGRRGGAPHRGRGHGPASRPGGRDQLAAIERHFGPRTRAVHVVPFDRTIGAGGPIGYDDVSSATRDAWLRIAADVADGL